MSDYYGSAPEGRRIDYHDRLPLPENLTHCSECGSAFVTPVSLAEAREWFPSVDVASFACRACSSQWGAEVALQSGEKKS